MENLHAPVTAVTPAISIGFIGGGQMCEAMLRGFLRAGIVHPSRVIVAEPTDTRRDYLKSIFDPSLKITSDNLLTLDRDIVIIAVKPQSVAEVLSPLKSQPPHSLIISIVAGVSLAELESSLPTGTRVVRCMPNTPAMISESASGFAMGHACLQSDEQLVKRLLHCIGPVAYPIPEKLLDAVTGLSGSGPAYAFVFIEAMADAAVSQGLPRDVALRLAAQTLVGAGKLVLEGKQHPGALKDSVCSPAGTTIAGIVAMEESGFRGSVMKGVIAAAKRSREISKGEK